MLRSTISLQMMLHNLEGVVTIDIILDTSLAILLAPACREAL